MKSANLIRACCSIVIVASIASTARAELPCLWPWKREPDCPAAVQADRTAELRERAEAKDARAQQKAQRITDRADHAPWYSHLLHPLQAAENVSRNRLIKKEIQVDDAKHRQMVIEMERQRLQYELERSRLRDYGPAVLHTKTGIDTQMKMTYGAWQLNLAKAKELIQKQEEAQKKIDKLREQDEERRKELARLKAPCLACGGCPCTCTCQPTREPILDEPTKIPLTIPVTIEVQPLRTDYQEVRVVRQPVLPPIPEVEPDCTDRPRDLPRVPPDQGDAARGGDCANGKCPLPKGQPPIGGADNKLVPQGPAADPTPKVQPGRSDHLPDSQNNPPQVPRQDIRHDAPPQQPLVRPTAYSRTHEAYVEPPDFPPPVRLQRSDGMRFDMPTSRYEPAVRFVEGE